MNVEQAPKTQFAGADPPAVKGKAAAIACRGNDPPVPVDGPAGVMTTARRKRKPAQHGRPPLMIDADQHATREGCAWSAGESERLIVPSKPGNAGGGKGPWFKRSVESRDRKGIGDEPTASD